MSELKLRPPKDIHSSNFGTISGVSTFSDAWFRLYDSGPVGAIEGAVLDGLAQVLRLDVGRAR